MFEVEVGPSAEQVERAVRRWQRRLVRLWAVLAAVAAVGGAVGAAVLQVVLSDRAAGVRAWAEGAGVLPLLGAASAGTVFVVSAWLVVERGLLVRACRAARPAPSPDSIDSCIRLP